jgi:hypothetical protein
MEHAEIPARAAKPAGNAESLGPVTKTNRGLYLAIIIVLGTILLIGVLGWLLLAANGKTAPDGLGVILGTVAGGLVALVTDASNRT